MKLVDYEVYGEDGDELVWVQVSQWPQYRCLLTDAVASSEIARCMPAPEEMNYEEFRSNFDALVAEINPQDSFYYEEWGNAMGLMKVKYSQIRSLLREWVTYVDFFGEELRFSFYGNATVSTDLHEVISALEQQGFTVCNSWDSSCDYKDDKMAWYSPERLGFYIYKRYDDNTYFSANVDGVMGQEATFYAYLGGYDPDNYMGDAKELMNQVAGIVGIDLGEIEFTTEIPEPRILEREDEETAISEEVAPAEPGYDPGGKPEREYKYYRFEKKIVIPDRDYEPLLSGWEKQEGMFYTTYRNGDMGVTLGKPYVSYWERTGEYGYDSVQIGENEVYTGITIDEPDFEKAKSELSAKISSIATVTGDWNLEYYPVGSGGWGPLYKYGMYEEGARAAGIQTLDATSGENAQAPQSPQPPSFDDSFGGAFNTLKSEISADEPHAAIGLEMIAVVTVLVIASMTSFIYLLLK
jgi:hypothetical protein